MAVDPGTNRHRVTMRGLEATLLVRSLAVLAFLSCKPGASTTGGPEDGRPALPQLPDDLQATFGSVYLTIKARHDAALPMLTPAPETPEEHTAWVDGVLEPWRTEGREIGVRLEELRPAFPDPDALDEQVVDYERLHLVHSALGATLSVDESIARITIPIPRAVAANPELKADLQKFGVITSLDMRKTYELWRSSCEYAGGHEATPSALMGWQTYCFEMADLLLSHTCDFEKRFGLGAEWKACQARPQKPADAGPTGSP